MPTKDVVEGYFGRLVQRASVYKKLALHNQSLAAEDTMNRLNHGKPRQYVVVSVLPQQGVEQWMETQTHAEVAWAYACDQEVVEVNLRGQ